MTKRPVDMKKTKEKISVDRGTVDDAVPPAKAGNASIKDVPIPESFWYGALAVIALLSFYLRAVLPMKAVFIGNQVRFSSESDAWYHMMLAKSTVLNLHRTFFDPLTFFPNGTSIHFGPFMDWGIAIISLIMGLGRPSMHTVDVVGAYWPVIMGVLLILPIYYLGKEIGGRGCGLMAAFFISVMPGQLFSRTVLGFTDHHSSEVLLSTIAMLFFLLAVKTGRNLTFKSLSKVDRQALKMPLTYALLAGLFLGLYIDAWSMGTLFEGILVLFIVIQGVVDHISRRNTDYLGILGSLTFGLAFLVVLPFANSANDFSIIQYSFFQPAMLLLWGALFVLLVSFASRKLSERMVSTFAFPGAVVGIALAEFLAMMVVLPKFTGTIISGFFTYLFPRSGGAATVAELAPLLREGGIQSNFPGLYGLSPFYFALIALALLAIRYVKKERPGDLLMVVWSIATLAITIAANRSAYYYTVNVAILCSYLVVSILDLEKVRVLKNSIMSGRSADIARSLRADQLAAALLIILIALPSVALSIQIANYTSGPQSDWYTSTVWLENNTPNPGLDIYKIYDRPAAGVGFDYPATAYGVMSWWDYGHLIETIGHRYPNANPFQEGIGSITKEIPGSSPFFLAENESTAENVLAGLDENRSSYLNTRYVMTDMEMAVGKFYAMTAWSSVPGGNYQAQIYQPQGEQLMPITIYREPYFRTMVSRLQFFDGSETPVDQAVGIVYRGMELQNGYSAPVMTESPKISSNYTEVRKFVDQKRSEGNLAEVVSTSPTISPVPVEALKHYRLVHESETSVTSDGQKYVKTFEHVPGAVIKGTAPAGSRVIIAVPIMTNHARTFAYIQTATAGSNGEYTLVVPYSTEGPKAWSTKFDTGPSGPYQLIAGGNSYEVKVPEELVMTGGVIRV